jgi:hypothetical protein
LPDHITTEEAAEILGCTEDPNDFTPTYRLTTAEAAERG